MRYIFMILLFSFSCSQPQNIEGEHDISNRINYETYGYEGFSFEEIKNFRVTLNENKGAWFQEGGDLNRYAFLNFFEINPISILKRPNQVRVLGENARADVRNFMTQSRLGQLSLDEYMTTDNVDAMIVIHKGEIVYEGYPRMVPNDYHIAFSVSKILVSTSIAILEDQNMMDAQKPIDLYFPRLKGSGWEGVPVVDILAMSSGIDCIEIFTMPEGACFFASSEAYGWPPTDKAQVDPITSLVTLKSKGPSGEKFEYSSINTMMLTMLVEKISGEPYHKFIEREIWQKIGAANNGLMLKASFGRDASYLGLNATICDIGRLGLIFTPSGRKEIQPLISDSYLDKIQNGYNKKLRTKSWFSDEMKYNGYQWDEIYEDGDFYKHGHSGQGLYISPSRDLVIAFFGTYDKDLKEHELPYVSRQLARSGLFD